MIQTFPDSFVWVGSKTDMEQMIGNAVPVKLAEFVATALTDYIQSVNQIEYAPGFYSWLTTEKSYSERVAKDILSRNKRAERLIPSHGVVDDYYMFTLEQQPKFQELPGAVRSQIKKAVQLLAEYYDWMNCSQMKMAEVG